ncbi:MAG TPA: hypothetical protein VGR07_16910 [Thermoanaerobaculia bacterium]|nr:hypothetical protein [Thermoanaerobaculia bacterium]
MTRFDRRHLLRRLLPILAAALIMLPATLLATPQCSCGASRTVYYYDANNNLIGTCTNTADCVNFQLCRPPAGTARTVYGNPTCCSCDIALMHALGLQPATCHVAASLPAWAMPM